MENVIEVNADVLEYTIRRMIGDRIHSNYDLTCPTDKPCFNFNKDGETQKFCEQCWYSHLVTEAAKELETVMKETATTQQYGDLTTYKKK